MTTNTNWRFTSEGEFIQLYDLWECDCGYASASVPTDRVLCPLCRQRSGEFVEMHACVLVSSGNAWKWRRRVADLRMENESLIVAGTLESGEAKGQGEVKAIPGASSVES